MRPPGTVDQRGRRRRGARRSRRRCGRRSHRRRHGRGRRCRVRRRVLVPCREDQAVREADDQQQADDAQQNGQPPGSSRTGLPGLTVVRWPDGRRTAGPYGRPTLPAFRDGRADRGLVRCRGRQHRGRVVDGRHVASGIGVDARCLLGRIEVERRADLRGVKVERRRRPGSHRGRAADRPEWRQGPLPDVVASGRVVPSPSPSPSPSPGPGLPPPAGRSLSPAFCAIGRFGRGCRGVESLGGIRVGAPRLAGRRTWAVPILWITGRPRLIFHPLTIVARLHPIRPGRRADQRPARSRSIAPPAGWTGFRRRTRGRS